MKTAKQEGARLAFPGHFPARQNQHGPPCWGPARMVPSSVVSEGRECVQVPLLPVTSQTPQIFPRALLHMGNTSSPQPASS